MTVQILRPHRLAHYAATAGALVFLVAATAAAAQQAEMSGAVRQACAGDVKTLCPTVQPGGGKIVACLRENAAKVSPGCKQAMKTAEASKMSSGGAKPAPPN
ncbi:cysteine rich repeat-containing protein [Phenylobacterium sp. LjRoot219]|uniref:cysteine rich repeat-containing protein n=1 Tax=Phenylobacterium sp. LjRoot219 TaxID=3342283 RepID=UPI003ECFC88B